MVLRFLLPLFGPLVTAWARRHEGRILHDGEPLSVPELRIARAVGVLHPERIRVCEVPRMPVPAAPTLRRLARWTGLPGPECSGMTLGYGIYLRRGQRSARLVAHECRHVHQYERARSVRRFMAGYLRQVAAHGYADAPLEVDARRAEAVLAGLDRGGMA